MTAFTPSLERGILRVVSAVVFDPRVKSATAYESPDQTIVATRRGKPDRRERHFELVLTIGRPNYRGRAFVKALLAAGAPFPVREARLCFWPNKRA